MNKYLCKKHGMDYRILCEECEEKYLELNKKIKETIQHGENIQSRN